MSVEAYAYVRRLSFGKIPGRKLILANLADTVDNDTKSWAIKPDTLAADSEMETRQAQNHLKALTDTGYLSVLECFNEQGKQTVSRLRIHGPWDLWGGTGRPFPETERPKKDRRLDSYTAREVTAEDRAELRRRLQELADREGFFKDGLPRARWRLGSRAHSLVCWYGLGNTVVHAGKKATVVELTDREGKKKAPLRVRLDYGNGPTTAWVGVDDLTDPTVISATPSEENRISEGVQPSAPSPVGGVQPSAPHGVQPSAPHGVQPSAPLPHQSLSAPRHQVSQEAAKAPARAGSGWVDEEEEKPSAKNGETAAEIVMRRTDATKEEAEKLIESLLEHARRRGRPVGSPSSYINGFRLEDLTYRLGEIRRERAPQGRAGTSEPTGPDAVCAEHREPLDCPVCAFLHPRMAQLLLNRFGPVRRPDLAARLAPADASS
ncbi:MULTISPECIES: hypothetical protein [Nocardiopsis]|uniref:Helix-turn-helix domain-containing protein n=1 Tax=Nocardiopsis changdeensis TaxID=2831969 RepID=A0ABX8BW82_9ACTN|nr:MULTISPECIES: hypothetical protein [Nocardiopsis]QUX26366.1 hypothetical protein KGD84_32210 [Nocardiopsis changdeensis]QYX40814.1 hypothetical protein K1J57_32965 [Nocardiopsis sp. MT53]